jgi:uncharacterized glyoxalase superfamily protein PhnB
MDQRQVRYVGISPYLYYEDADAALDWLSRALGFQEIVRWVDPDGAVQEAEMRAGDTVIQVCGCPGYFAQRGVTGALGQENILYVDDVDAHHARAREAGAKAEDPEDKPYGVRSYGLRDPGGHSWIFWQRLTDEVQLQPGWREIRNGRVTKEAAAT